MTKIASPSKSPNIAQPSLARSGAAGLFQRVMRFFGRTPSALQSLPHPQISHAVPIQQRQVQGLQSQPTIAGLQSGGSPGSAKRSLIEEFHNPEFAPSRTTADFIGTKAQAVGANIRLDRVHKDLTSRVDDQIRLFRHESAPASRHADAQAGFAEMVKSTRAVLSIHVPGAKSAGTQLEDLKALCTTDGVFDEGLFNTVCDAAVGLSRGMDELEMGEPFPFRYDVNHEYTHSSLEISKDAKGNIHVVAQKDRKLDVLYHQGNMTKYQTPQEMPTFTSKLDYIIAPNGYSVGLQDPQFRMIAT